MLLGVCAGPVVWCLPFRWQHPLGPLRCPALGTYDLQLPAARRHFLPLILLAVLKQPILPHPPHYRNRETEAWKAQALTKSPEARQTWALTQQTWPTPWEEGPPPREKPGRGGSGTGDEGGLIWTQAIPLLLAGSATVCPGPGAMVQCSP